MVCCLSPQIPCTKDEALKPKKPKAQDPEPSVPHTRQMMLLLEKVVPGIETHQQVLALLRF